MAETEGVDSSSGAGSATSGPADGSGGPVSSESSDVTTEGSAESTDTDPTGDTDETGDPPTCRAIAHDSSPVVWTLPDFSALGVTSSDTLQQLAGGSGCENGEDFLFSTTDLTGDGMPDLVVTDGCDAGGVGVERWIVHPWEGGGFGAATTWTLPNFGPLGVTSSDVLQQLAGGSGCENGEDFLFTTTDLTGDGMPDLVVTDGCDAGGVGVERWIVHPGEDGGFGAATTWTLPDFGPLGVTSSDVLQQLAGGSGCENGEDFLFTTTDLTGDGMPDLVVTDGCDAGGVGVERWIVHPWEGGGFGAATTWTLPDFGPLGVTSSDVLQQLAGGSGCENGEDFLFSTTDLTGDGMPDLVVTDGCDAGGVGVERWIVHPGEDAGFGAAATWGLPDFGPLGVTSSDVLQQLAGGSGCENGEDFLFTATDLTGDGLSDLVVTDGCDAGGVGAERWIVHPAVCE